MAGDEELFIETMRWSGGRFHLAELHRNRMERTRKEVFGRFCPAIGDWLPHEPEMPADVTLKCRVTYGREIQDVKFVPYVPKTVRSLRLVDGGGIDYHLKRADRSGLVILAEGRGDADEVIIVRDGCVTDTSYSNLVFESAAGLITPSTPLLRGVMVEHLLRIGKVTERLILADDLSGGNRYGITGVYLVNAMLPLGSVPPVGLENII